MRTDNKAIPLNIKLVVNIYYLIVQITKQVSCSVFGPQSSFHHLHCLCAGAERQLQNLIKHTCLLLALRRCRLPLQALAVWLQKKDSSLCLPMRLLNYRRPSIALELHGFSSRRWRSLCLSPVCSSYMQHEGLSS